MFGLLIVLAVFAVLGFLLSWIINVVANEELGVLPGVLILLGAGVLSLLVNAGLEAILPDEAIYIAPVVQFAILTLMINLGAKVSWKHAAIVAGIYAAILTVVGLVIGSMS